MAVIIRCEATISGVTTDPYLLSQWYLPSTVGGSNTDATNCLAHFRSVWNVLAGKIVTGALITYSPSVIAMEATTGVLTGAWVGTTPATSAGAAGSSPLPLQTQGMITWATGQIFNGRRLKGRVYVPAPDEADNVTTGAVPSSSYLSQLASAITAMNTAVTGGSLPVVWHRPTPGGSNGGHGAITGGVARSTWSSQRKRR
jgi:hypothetical protein